MTVERGQGRQFTMVGSTLEVVSQQSGLPPKRVEELCAKGARTNPSYLKWLDSADPKSIARWVRRTDDFERETEENW